MKYKALREFIDNHCPRKHNYCNGQHIPFIVKIGEKDSCIDKGLDVCEHYQNGCKHPERRKGI